MLRLKFFFTVFVLLHNLFPAQSQSLNDKTILATESRRFEAMTRADTAALRPMLAEALVYVHSNAMKENKTEHLNAIGSRKLVYESMERLEASVRKYGKTALVNGTVKVRGVLNGNAFEIRLLYVAVYHKKHGVYQLVHWQSTKLP